MSKKKEALERLRDLPDDELIGAMARAREELFRLRMLNYTNQIENPLAIRFKRREVAQLMTIARGRQLGLETQAQAGTGKEG